MPIKKTLAQKKRGRVNVSAGRTHDAQVASRINAASAAGRKKATDAAAAATESKINKPPVGGLGGLAKRARAKRKKS